MRANAPAAAAGNQPVPAAVRPAAIPEKFDGTRGSDWTSWLAHFDQVAVANNWLQADQVRYIALYLTGPAQLFFQSLDQNIRTGGLQPLLAALGNRFAPAAHADLHRAELKARTQTSNEPLSEYCEAVRKLTRLAYPTLAQNVLDTLAKDHFLSGIMDRNIRLDARRGAPATLDEALTHALQAQAIFATELQPEPIVPVCAVAAQQDLSAVLSQVLDRLGRLEATVQSLRVPPGRHADQGRPRCYGCGNTNHFIADCPNTPSRRGRGRGGWTGGRQGN